MGHKNLDDNEDLHHLYEIIDKKDISVFKYGISCGPIGKDGLSKRMRVQLRLANLIDNWPRFFARIIIYDIPGRREAKRLEREYIQKYKEEQGTRPRGNLTD
ncbi:MAG: hypothetical protein KF852_08195 [Saprospiraceae bacterium]|nr:hypothetical protein [Saprospiraceae bacterium]